MVSTRIFSSKLSVSQLTAKNIFLMYSPGLKFTITIKQNNGKSSLKDFAYKIGVISEQVSTPEAWNIYNKIITAASNLVWSEHTSLPVKQNSDLDFKTSRILRLLHGEKT